MGNRDITLNKKIHSTELTTGKNKTGHLKISSEKISTEIFSYDGYFSLSGKNPIHLFTHENNHVSLYGNSGGMPSTRYSFNHRTTHNCKIDSNIAVVGPGKWKWEDRVKRCRFTLPRVMDVIKDTNVYKKIKHSDPDDKVFDQIFTVSNEHYTVRYKCTLFYNFYDKYPSQIEPYFEMEFRNLVDLDEFYKASKYLSDLFSLLFSFPNDHAYSLRRSNDLEQHHPDQDDRTSDRQD